MNKKIENWVEDSKNCAYKQNCNTCRYRYENRKNPWKCYHVLHETEQYEMLKELYMYAKELEEKNNILEKATKNEIEKAAKLIVERKWKIYT